MLVVKIATTDTTLRDSAEKYEEDIFGADSGLGVGYATCSYNQMSFNLRSKDAHILLHDSKHTRIWRFGNHPAARKRKRKIISHGNYEETLYIFGLAKK